MKISSLVKTVILVLVLIVLSLVLILDESTLKPAELEQVRLGTSSSITNSLMFIALDQGFFEEEGIELIFEPYPSSQSALEDVFTSKLDLVITAETPVVFKSFEREDFMIIASVYSAYNDPKIIGLLNKGIKTPEDLAGKTIGTTKEGQAAHYFLHLFLSKYGLVDAGINMVHMSPSDLVDELSGGEIDAISIFEPYVSRATSLIPSQTIVFSEPKLYFKFAVLVGQQSFVTDNPIIVQKVLSGLLQAQEFIINNNQEATQAIASRLGIGVSEVDQAWKTSIISVALDQNLLLTMENEATWALENNFVEGTTVPNFLDFIYFAGLEEIDSFKVTIIH